MNHDHHKSDTPEETFLIPPHEFAEWGMGEMAYIKPVRLDGVTVFAIFAANGEQLGLVQSCDAAIRDVMERQLEPVRVQ